MTWKEKRNKCIPVCPQMPCGMGAGNEQGGREMCPRARQSLHPAPAVEMPSCADPQTTNFQGFEAVLLLLF